MASPLIGHTITAVQMDGMQDIKFILADRPPVIYRTDADCCSSTWIAHVEGVDRLIGGTVVSVEDIPMPGNNERDDDERYIQFYGLAIKTDKGTAVIDYRNESNGYYGGSISSDEENHYGGVFGQNVGSGQFVPLVEDF